MKNSILLKEGSICIKTMVGIPEDIVEFLDSISWGTEGAIYEHKNTREHIKSLVEPTLIVLTDEDKIQGMAVFCHTPVLVGIHIYNSYYIRYFASTSDIRGKGVMKKYAVKVMAAIRTEEKEKTVFFASVEKGNKASYKVVHHAGYRDIGTIKTMGFSRFFPKANNAICKVSTHEERQEIIQLLKSQYQNHSLVQFNAVFNKNNYFVIRVKGEIVAGCQYHRAHWVVNHMPGITGKFIMHLVPVIPLINRLFNPRKFEFLAFEAMIMKPGYENYLEQLFEGLLYRENLKTSLFWMDENCPVRKSINTHIRCGIIKHFVKSSDVRLMASYKGLNDDEIRDVQNKPLYASSYDYI